MKGIVLGVGLSLASSAVVAQGQQGDPKATEQWSPAVPVVTPGAFAGWTAPAAAVVLFDGKGLDRWASVKTGGAAGWTSVTLSTTSSTAAGATLDRLAEGVGRGDSPGLPGSGRGSPAASPRKGRGSAAGS